MLAFVFEGESQFQREHEAECDVGRVAIFHASGIPLTTSPPPTSHATCLPGCRRSRRCQPDGVLSVRRVTEVPTTCAPG